MLTRLLAVTCCQLAPFLGFCSDIVLRLKVRLYDDTQQDQGQASGLLVGHDHSKAASLRRAWCALEEGNC